MAYAKIVRRIGMHQQEDRVFWSETISLLQDPVVHLNSMLPIYKYVSYLETRSPRGRAKRERCRPSSLSYSSLSDTRLTIEHFKISIEMAGSITQSGNFQEWL